MCVLCSAVTHVTTILKGPLPALPALLRRLPICDLLRREPGLVLGYLFERDPRPGHHRSTRVRTIASEGSRSRCAAFRISKPAWCAQRRDAAADTMLASKCSRSARVARSGAERRFFNSLLMPDRPPPMSAHTSRSRCALTNPNLDYCCTRSLK